MDGKSDNGAQPSRSDNTTGKRFIRVDAIYSRKDRQVHLVRTAVKPNFPSKLHKYALIVKRDISNKGIVARTYVEINSQCLSGLLQDVFPEVESLGLDKQSPEVSRETLWHARPALLERLEQERTKDDRTRDDVVISDIETTLGFLDDEYVTTTSQFAALQSKDLISYNLLWCLFPPGAEIYTDVNALHEPQVLRCKSYSFQEDSQTGEKWFEIVGQCLNTDGQSFSWFEQILKLPIFGGTVQITSLVAYPLACHPEQMDIRDRLHARGESFVRLLAQPMCREYDAVALMSHRVGTDWEQETVQTSGRVMVDPNRFSKSCSVFDPLCEIFSSHSKAFAPEKTPSKDLMFCHYRILGFSFDQKRWAGLAVSQLRDPEWNDKAFDKVIMPLVKRELVRSLVFAHRTENDKQAGFDDIIKGKGRGLVGLLSGAPGVGKTLTAEAVAEVSHRPLYAVSAGELGTEVSGVDTQLGKVLGIASSWKCVLLIDECDVFLRQRDHVSLVNNALVSIFLRRLEYFQGLAILTTNRVDDIDKALLSRLHFKFHYEDLGSNQRLALWKSFLDLVGNLDETKLETLAKDYQVNGREIKNAVFCAKLIAQSRGSTLTTDLIEEVLVELLGQQHGVRS